MIRPENFSTQFKIVIVQQTVGTYRFYYILWKLTSKIKTRRVEYL